jgi:hypothetical protein
MPASALQREIIDFTISFEQYGSALVDDAVARQRAEVPDFLGDDEDVELVVRDATAVGVAVALSAIRLPGDLPPSSPGASSREARMAAARGVPLASFMHSYRVGHAVFQEHFLAHAVRIGASSSVLRAVTRSMFDYVDWLLPLAEQEYLVARSALDATPERLWFERVRAVIDDGAADDLGHPLDGCHLAVVLDDDGGAGDGVALLEAIAREAGGSALAARCPDGDLWGWLEGEALDEDAVLERLRATPALHGAGVSGIEQGRAGFVAAHRKAKVARQLGVRRGERVSAYRDVALEALAFGGPQTARDFARAELGPLAEDSDRVAALRETVHTYFSLSSSSAAAAEVLGIAERTVTYRLRRAEELIGRPLSERRTELEAALRLHRLLDVSG